jgi:hypothetical protein
MTRVCLHEQGGWNNEDTKKHTDHQEGISPAIVQYQIVDERSEDQSPDAHPADPYGQGQTRSGPLSRVSFLLINSILTNIDRHSECLFLGFKKSGLSGGR